MRKIFFACVAVLLSLYMFSACKKNQHPTNPTPGNYRMMSYDKITDYKTDEKYTFSYDVNGRVSLIMYSTNLPGASVVAERIIFKYSSDSIYKTIYNATNNDTLESDTFIINTSNQISSVYNPNSIFNYQYYGKLLSRETNTYRDSGTTIQYTKTYTSDNADLLNRYFDGTLNANFSDTGFKSTAVINDTDFSTPFTDFWVVGTNQLAVSSQTIEHDGVSGLHDAISGYNNGGPVVLQAIDGNGVSLRQQCVVPGDLWAQESFYVWPDKVNRTGDYLQLASFTTYGIDIYANAHLTKAIVNPGNTTNITYDIDADSKVTQATAIIRDSLTHHSTTVVYRVQYTTY